ncbi:MAG: DUF167 domain-containing protein [Syntrophorhabdaceae bacterium]|nr:DUF167 domain-containing protein [Syntrophorhabdaceae bacterium]
MNIEVKVVVNAKKREIKREGKGLKVKVLSLPQEGRANSELVDYLSETFGVKRSEIKILKGEKERKKLISIPIDDETLKRIV